LPDERLKIGFLDNISRAQKSEYGLILDEFNDGFNG